MWFGHEDIHGPYQHKALLQEHVKAAMICKTECPIQQRRRCAASAIENEDEYGVWAGIYLPGHQLRYAEDLNDARDELRAIAGIDKPESPRTKIRQPDLLRFPCGTPAAYGRHLRHGETPCGPCRDAYNTQQRTRRRHKKAS